MNNHYDKIEYKGIKTVGVTGYTNQTPPTHFGWKKCLSSTPIKKTENINQMCTIFNVCTSSMCEQSLCKG